MVANKPGNLDGETAGSTVWTPPNELVVAAARARDAVAPSAERSALLKEKERQRSKRRRENATAEQRAKERARSARRRNALTPEEKQANGCYETQPSTGCTDECCKASIGVGDV